MELSPRLSMIENLIEGPVTCLGDVGTDHGWLPVWAILQGKAHKAIASDIKKGPLERASRNVTEHDLSHKIELRLCAGLSGYAPGECDWTVIAGMGGHLICEILEEALSRGGVKEGQSFVISPHTHEPKVRKFLYTQGFRVLGENACADAGHIYLAICCVYDGVSRQISEVDAVLGCKNILPPLYYKNIIQKARKRIAGLEAGSETEVGLTEIRFLQEVVRKAEGL